MKNGLNINSFTPKHAESRAKAHGKLTLPRELMSHSHNYIYYAVIKNPLLSNSASRTPVNEMVNKVKDIPKPSHFTKTKPIEKIVSETPKAVIRPPLQPKKVSEGLNLPSIVFKAKNVAKAREKLKELITHKMGQSRGKRYHNLLPRVTGGTIASERISPDPFRDHTRNSIPNKDSELSLIIKEAEKHLKPKKEKPTLKIKPRIQNHMISSYSAEVSMGEEEIKKALPGLVVQANIQPVAKKAVAKKRKIVSKIGEVGMKVAPKEEKGEATLIKPVEGLKVNYGNKL